MLWRNPVLAREMSLTSRNWRVPVLLMVAAGQAGGMALLFLAAAGVGQPPGALPTQTGPRLFSLLALVQLALVVLLAPGLTAGGLSGERERRTLEPLWQAGLSPLALVLGKLLAAMAYLLLLLVAAAPATGLLFLLGGIPLRQVGLAYAVCALTGLLLIAWGTCASALNSRTQGAAAVAYVGAITLLLGTLLPTWLAGSALDKWGVPARVFIAAAGFNPPAALAATTGGPFFRPVLAAALGPALPGSLALAADGTGGGSFTPPLDPGNAAAGLATAQVPSNLPGPMLQITHRYLLFAGALSLLLILIATLAMRPPRGRGLRAALGLRGGVRHG